MYKLITTIVLGFIALTGYKKEDNSEPSPEPINKTDFNFSGIWKRLFKTGPINLHIINYFISKDSIRYKLTGPIGNTNYLMDRNTFLIENNRFIGYTSSNKYY